MEKLQKFICQKCGYRFTRKPGSKVTLRCPYCSGEFLVEDRFDINKEIERA